MRQQEVLERIVVERFKQDHKWGRQEHSLPEWLTVLAEEMGELAAAILGHRWGTEMHPELDWRKEAIQVAAVAVAMLEYGGEALTEGGEDGE